jgi:predicted transglutaminase-like cysteine proteinase
MLLAAAGLTLGLTTMSAHAQSFMQSGGRTTQPVGHYEFCQRTPVECQQTTLKQAPVELTRKLWAQIVEINNLVNTMVAPRTDW